MSGDYHGSVRRVIAVDPDIGDISVDIAQESVRRAWRAGIDLPDCVPSEYRATDPDLAAAVDRHIMSTVNGSRDLGSGDQAMRRSWMSRTASGGISGVKGTNSGAGG
jgi:hypothetical protein